MLEKREMLDRLLHGYGRVLVAYSGGVDSAYLLARACRVLGEGCLGMLADSPSLARTEKEAALGLARRMGARVEVVETREFENPQYTANPVNRCYFCKAELFTVMEGMAKARGFSVLAYGENLDDMGDARPGRLAAEEFRVVAPLRDAGLTKAEIRELSRGEGLPTAEKPASPCLSSRIPHGTPVTVEALRRVEQAEAALKGMGFRILRVRHHGDLARLELGEAEFSRYDDPATRAAVVKAVKEAGYISVERAESPYGVRAGAGTAATASL